ncbi:sugar transferase [Bacilli bacterium]|nr:capsular biosynthesis protein [Bacilli bacterium VT-13-104]PZD84334.1 sugar transferase [Bacilli bacterium]PZD86027.1 sugar transferase [Bacilli bacterium]PZD89249.1 sugar transferase [Bacilli bacterium]RCO09550.1 sugar transferase [Bacilli bacterium]
MYLKIKRLIDIIFSLIGLIVLSPIFLILIIAIKIDSRGPILFRQKRVGINKKHFNILKFRTMRIDTPKDTPTHLLENPDQYITKIGKFLRKTSLDELPQIWNIFVGQMSIIGPRPALWNQYDLIEERDKYNANDVPPGLTGWAQINGRDELPIEVKAKLDGEYVGKISFWMDVKCFFGTIVSVVKSDGVVEGGTGAENEVASTKESISK